LTRHSVGVLEKKVVVAMAGKIAESRSLRGASPGWIRFRTDEQRVAIHEAAHAVIAMVFGLYVYSASVEPDAASAGRVVYGFRPARPHWPEIEQVHDDRKSVALMCWALVGCSGWRQALQRVRVLRVRTAELVDEHWPAIVELAGELIRRVELSQTEIADLLRSFPRGELSRAENTWIFPYAPAA
jgi:hypothetical protein